MSCLCTPSLLMQFQFEPQSGPHDSNDDETAEEDDPLSPALLAAGGAVHDPSAGVRVHQTAESVRINL